MEKRNLFFKVAILISSITLLSGCGTNSFANNVEVNTYNVSENARSIQTFSSEINNPSSFEETNDDLDVTMVSYSKTNLTQTIQFRVEISEYAEDDPNYYIGYYGKDYNYPAYLSGTYSNEDGETFEFNSEILKQSAHGLGSNLGLDYFSSYCDVEVPYDCTLNLETIELKNIFKVEFEYDEDGVIKSSAPDFDTNYFYELNTTKVTKRELSNVLDCTFVEFSSYNNYLSVRAKFDNFGKETYPLLSSTTKKLYESNLDNIESGVVKIRTRLSIGADTYLRIYKNNEDYIDLKNASGDLKFFEDVNYGIFLIEDLTKDDVKNFLIYGASVSVELFNTTTSKIVPRSTVTTRYGLIDFKMQNVFNSDNTIAISAIDSSKYTNYSAIFIIFSVIFLVVYVGVAIGYYFYLKKKDSKSEFKVLNNKNFIKVGILGFIFLGSLLVDILYINARTNLLKNSLTVYNPLDWVIMLTSVIVICLGGYFIKYFWTAYKDHKEKVAREKLNLNADKDDDGTN